MAACLPALLARPGFFLRWFVFVVGGGDGVVIVGVRANSRFENEGIIRTCVERYTFRLCVSCVNSCLGFFGHSFSYVDFIQKHGILELGWVLNARVLLF